MSSARERWERDGVVAVPAEVAAHWRAEGWWRDRTLWDDFAEAAAARPNSAAVVSRDSSGGVRTLSYRQLRLLVTRCAGGLLNLGVEPGEVVTVQLPNWWEYAVIGLACTRVGAVLNPVVPIYREREMRFILERTRSRVCVAPQAFRGFDHGEMLARLQQDLPQLEHVFVLRAPASSLPAVRSFEDHFLRRRWEDETDRTTLEARAPDADDVAQVMFTSGTTGEPKGVIHTYNTAFAAARGHELLGLSRDDPVLVISPVGHQTGYLHGYVVPFSHGMTAVYQDVWDPAVMLELVQDEGVAWTMASTPFLVDAIAEQRRNPRDLSSFRIFSTAGTPIPPHVVREARDVLGVELVAIWGMTENGVPSTTRLGDSVDVVSGSDGQPVPWMELRVVDEKGDDLAVGDVGRLLVRGAGQCVGYFRRRDLYEAAVDADGWFDTGDLARWRSDGGIRIAGRTKDIIIRGGENVPVLEVEALLYQHPAVAEVALVGYPDESDLGERSCAFVVPRGSPPTLEDLKAHLAGAGMAKQFWPEHLVIVDELPKTAAGKIQKHTLRRQVDVRHQARRQR